MMVFKASYLLIYPYLLSIEHKGEHIGTISLLALVVYFGNILAALLSGLVFELGDPRLPVRGHGRRRRAADPHLLAPAAPARLRAGAPRQREAPVPASARLSRAFLVKLGLVMFVLYFSAYLTEPFFSLYWEQTLGQQTTGCSPAWSSPSPAWRRCWVCRSTPGRAGEGVPAGDRPRRPAGGGRSGAGGHRPTGPGARRPLPLRLGALPGHGAPRSAALPGQSARELRPRLQQDQPAQGMGVQAAALAGGVAGAVARRTGCPSSSPPSASSPARRSTWPCSAPSCRDRAPAAPPPAGARALGPLNRRAMSQDRIGAPPGGRAPAVTGRLGEGQRSASSPRPSGSSPTSG